MNVLVINCGSSSLKYQLFNMEDESVLAKGLVERIGIEGSRLKHEVEGKDKKTIEVAMKDHKDALAQVLDAIVHPEHGAIASLQEINAVGHRVVHAGEKYSASVIVDKSVMAALEECIELAPLHNPPNIIGISAIEELLPGVKNVAVFDTAFHQTMPASAYVYALPYEYYEKDHVRRYGFHGTSHRYVSQRTAELLGKPLSETKIITCHLGNGASLAAIDGGKSVDTSMGFTPLEGLVMGTRCGDIDPQIVTYVMGKENITLEQMNDIMNKKSGVLGISGVSSDFRDVEDAAAAGNERAILALDIYHSNVRKYIAAYAAVLGGVDAIVFTAGLGENGVESREEICKNLEFMGAVLDPVKNKVRGKEAFVNTDDSKVKIMVVPTNEELTIARDTLELVK
ncbi:acetate kinase [Fusibacter bizertensis]|uniref:Acetate kinase n=1 Tax=Fusibacter bizertensis TaxID=1488331 RepID=A0ABT6N8C9_9FIRM|nr:acetate kinase [Fusibacter bizertensis]MDH8676662.1 acetate kinase [Fusibacter bizertensis]